MVWIISKQLLKHHRELGLHCTHFLHCPTNVVLPPTNLNCSAALLHYLFGPCACPIQRPVLKSFGLNTCTFVLHSRGVFSCFNCFVAVSYLCRAFTWYIFCSFLEIFMSNVIILFYCPSCLLLDVVSFELQFCMTCTIHIHKRTIKTFTDDKTIRWKCIYTHLHKFFSNYWLLDLQMEILMLQLIKSTDDSSLHHKHSYYDESEMSEQTSAE